MVEEGQGLGAEHGEGRARGVEGGAVVVAVAAQKEQDVGAAAKKKEKSLMQNNIGDLGGTTDLPVGASG